MVKFVFSGPPDRTSSHWISATSLRGLKNTAVWGSTDTESLLFYRERILV